MTFQDHVNNWVRVCLGTESLLDKSERNHRFLEESLELVQSACMSKEQALAVVEYVYGRPPGELRQEVGGVALTLAALCTAHGVNEKAAAIDELARAQGLIEQIHAKQKGKPR